MYDAIKNFARQFEYEPKIEGGQPKKFEKIIVAGMGGSGLAGALLKVWKPSLDIVIHRDYGLPELPKKELRSSLLIANSYSGNTEETLDVFERAGKMKMSRAAISIGGKLIELAKKEGVPYIRMPDTGIQPRMALGFNFKALLKVARKGKALKEAARMSRLLNPMAYKARGYELAKKFKKRLPIIYASRRNEALAYTWKIKFNETAKIPAFSNVFSELNHNEMAGFDVITSTRGLSKNVHFIFLHDAEDSSKMQKRMKITAQLYRDKKLPVEIVDLRGKNIFHKIFSSLVLADWIAYFTAEQYGTEPEEIPMVEEFKKLIA
ncbi:MAG: bifunctional phosphoglucose/phosphomannose isomerase [Parcubacteria group bacterium]|nr:bifunctional phosphoglucose/phosphomannose isomerase [Parcubacteria group bacterium]